MQPNTYVNELAYAHTLVSYTQDSMSNILHVTSPCATWSELIVVYLPVRTKLNWRVLYADKNWTDHATR